MWDREQTKLIEKILQDFKQFESNQEFDRRIRVINDLTNVIRKWIMECGRILKKDENIYKKWGGAVFPFGSY